MRVLWFVILSVAISACGRAGSANSSAPARLDIVRPAKYSGMMDASGAVAVTSNLFLVADDEQNKLCLYHREQGGPPVKQFNLDAFLEVTGKALEADLEGGARIGDRAYWIGSHGRNADGKPRPNRCRFFATDLHVTGGDVTVTPVGRPYKSLLDDLIADARFAPFRFADAATRPPKSPDALNIEGLAAMPDGKLLLGFRNPIPDGKTLLIPLNNPNDVLAGQRAALGDAIQLDLGGLGIRDIALHERTYVIIAGSAQGGGPFRIYFWSGPGARPEAVTVKRLKDYHPEAIVIYPQLGLSQIQILSDDGKLDSQNPPAGAAADTARQTFRSFWLER